MSGKSKWIVVSTAVTFGRSATQPVRRLEDAGCEVRLNPYGRPLDKEELIEFAHDADAIILGNDQLPASVIKRLKKLKVIARYGVGFDGVDLAEARDQGIVVTYAPATNREETADFTFGLILDLERHISRMVMDTRAGGWKKYTGTSLYGKTIGIIGVGQIGTAVARRALGFGMDILGYDIVQRNEAAVYGVVYTTLNDLLRRSDIVTIHLPLDESTRNLIGSRELRLIKPGSILINTARAGIVRHGALDKALRDGRLAGFAIDVFSKEPPEHQPYYDYDNVLVTPHVAGNTYESSQRMGNVVVDNILSVKEGVEPPDPVTPQHLYESMLAMGGGIGEGGAPVVTPPRSKRDLVDKIEGKGSRTTTGSDMLQIASARNKYTR
jgi:D-3-phosphoglycerate dehydrogenase